MATNIDNERNGILVEDTISGYIKFYSKNEYEPILENGSIKIEKLEDRSNTGIVDDISNMGTITDLGSSVSVPGTIGELFDIVRLFFLDSSATGGQYRIHTMPQQIVGGSAIAYTGFSIDLSALTSDSSWAVKKMYQDGVEEWAGKTAFDQILDNYSSLSYS